MKFILIFCFFSFSCASQIIQGRLPQLDIRDSTMFFNRNLTLVKITRKNKIDLSSIKNGESSLIIISINSNVLENRGDGSTQKVEISFDEYFTKEWRINVRLTDASESFAIQPMFCNNDYLIINFYGVKKIRRKNKGYKTGYIETQVYKLGDSND